MCITYALTKLYQNRKERKEADKAAQNAGNYNDPNYHPPPPRQGANDVPVKSYQSAPPMQSGMGGRIGYEPQVQREP